jgi:trehalose 6-phosphate synthase/phosphatase
MSRILIVSNRLPNQITIDENGDIKSSPSVGGLATGMKSVFKHFEGDWIGWPGFTNDEIDAPTKQRITDSLVKEDCIPVFLERDEYEAYYEGFSNGTVWPLFHYFTEFTQYSHEQWEHYQQVNQKFADVVLENLEGVNMVWIHDYHLLLLPAMIKEVRPDISIGFFLHIPFPSYEIFRILPWRDELLNGLLGADLIGFHTYDYQRHFSSCVRRLLGYDISMDKISFGNRVVKIDSFPMGIDFDRFNNAALNACKTPDDEKPLIRREIENYFSSDPERKLILSIDRLDYTKGIVHRLHAFEYFLEKYPEYIGKTTLILLSVPSRVSVLYYQKMKSEIDETVGRINGRFGMINWNPIWYFYRSFPFADLVELYNACQIALITPLRDGMNLVAKEYVATKTDNKGVLILSEMAGASREMSEAIIINPNNKEQIASSIHEALLMPEDEQIERNKILRNRLQRYSVGRWATDFIHQLIETDKLQKTFLAKKLTEYLLGDIRERYLASEKRLILLDYDGTLVGFKNNPEQAGPDDALYALLDKLSGSKKNSLALVSGRDKETFMKWFGPKAYTLITDHGVWIRKKDDAFKMVEDIDPQWKEYIRPKIELYVDRTPGSFIEEKNFSLVWHYRKSDPELGAMRAIELKDELSTHCYDLNLEILEGKKVLEIKNRGINKGRAAQFLTTEAEYDFILAIGDDWTDEYLFESLPETAITIKVGAGFTKARYKLEDHNAVRNFLENL